MQELPPRQQRFVDEYIIDMNATQAAIRAGYAKTSARVTGVRLITKVPTATAIREKLAIVQERHAVDAAWVTAKAVEIVQRCMDEKPFRPQPAINALNLIARRFPEFSIKAEVSITREERIVAVMTALSCDREHAEEAIAEAERLIGGS